MIKRLLIEIDAVLGEAAIALEIGIEQSCFGGVAHRENRVELKKTAAVIVADLGDATVRLGHRAAEFGHQRKARKMLWLERRLADQMSCPSGMQRRRIGAHHSLPVFRRKPRKQGAGERDPFSG